MNFAQGSSPGGKERVNEQAVKAAEQEAQRFRELVIDLGHVAVSLSLGEDIVSNAVIESEGYPVGKKFGVYILDDMSALAAPRLENGDLQRTLSLLLERNGGLIRKGKLNPDNIDRMHIYIPIPDEFDIYDSDIPEPEKIFVERTYPSGDVVRYVITKNSMYMYETEAHEGEDVTHDDLSDKVLHRAVSDRAYNYLPQLVSIYNDLVNMDAVPQRIITIGEPDVIDI